MSFATCRAMDSMICLLPSKTSLLSSVLRPRGHLIQVIGTCKKSLEHVGGAE